MGIPALERDFALDVFNRLHVMEMKPAFAEVTAGHEDEMYKMARTMLVAARHVDGGLSSTLSRRPSGCATAMPNTSRVTMR